MCGSDRPKPMPWHNQENETTNNQTNNKQQLSSSVPMPVEHQVSHPALHSSNKPSLLYPSPSLPPLVFSLDRSLTSSPWVCTTLFVPFFSVLIHSFYISPFFSLIPHTSRIFLLPFPFPSLPTLSYRTRIIIHSFLHSRRQQQLPFLHKRNDRHNTDSLQE